MEDKDDLFKQVEKQAEKQAMQILKDEGLDVGASIKRILKDQIEESNLRELKTAIPTTQNTMTSELVYLSQTGQKHFNKEYFRRLDLLEFSRENIQGLYENESNILSRDKIILPQTRKQPWLQRYLLFPEVSTPQNLPKPEDLTLSELILITDDANCAIVRDHRRFNGVTYDALLIASTDLIGSQGIYYNELNNRLENYGWSNQQYSSFCSNENNLLARFKWGYHDNELWTPKSTDLRQFK